MNPIVILRLIDTRHRVEANIWVARGRVVARQLRESRATYPSNVIAFPSRPTGGAA